MVLCVARKLETMLGLAIQHCYVGIMLAIRSLKTKINIAALYAYQSVFFQARNMRVFFEDF
jgi:hypothetical protein